MISKFRQYWLIWIVILLFVVAPLRLCAQTSVISPVSASSLPAQLVNVSPSFERPYLIGVKINQDNPFELNFIFNPGSGVLSETELRREVTLMAGYFLAALTVPDRDLWVNLSPYERERVVPIALGQIPMGQELLSQDYLLKQLSASLTYPDSPQGQVYWQAVKDSNTLQKVWIAPATAVIYEDHDRAILTEAKLKVLCDDDYIAQSRSRESRVDSMTRDFSKQATGQNSVNTKAFKEHILPLIEKEVNEGKNFSATRQIYRAVILANWFKARLKDAAVNLLSKGKNKIRGILAKDPQFRDKVYARYLQAFKRGVYNYIKTETSHNKIVKRSYFSGGADLRMEDAFSDSEAPTMRRKTPDNLLRLSRRPVAELPADSSELPQASIARISLMPSYSPSARPTMRVDTQLGPLDIAFVDNNAGQHDAQGLPIVQDMHLLSEIEDVLRLYDSTAHFSFIPADIEKSVCIRLYLSQVNNDKYSTIKALVADAFMMHQASARLFDLQTFNKKVAKALDVERQAVGKREYFIAPCDNFEWLFKVMESLISRYDDSAEIVFSSVQEMSGNFFTAAAIKSTLAPEQIDYLHMVITTAVANVRAGRYFDPQVFNSDIAEGLSMGVSNGMIRTADGYVKVSLAIAADKIDRRRLTSKDYMLLQRLESLIIAYDERARILFELDDNGDIFFSLRLSASFGMRGGLLVRLMSKILNGFLGAQDVVLDVDKVNQDIAKCLSVSVKSLPREIVSVTALPALSGFDDRRGRPIVRDQHAFFAMEELLRRYDRSARIVFVPIAGPKHQSLIEMKLDSSLLPGVARKVADVLFSAVENLNLGIFNMNDFRGDIYKILGNTDDDPEGGVDFKDAYFSTKVYGDKGQLSQNIAGLDLNIDAFDGFSARVMEMHKFDFHSDFGVVK